jgi:hypothetical protein
MMLTDRDLSVLAHIVPLREYCLKVLEKAGQ